MTSINYPVQLMWKMTQNEREAYATIVDKKRLLSDVIMKKYGLTVYARLPVPPTHWLVCRWLESHPDEQDQFGQLGLMYYDVLGKAEQEYLDLLPHGERQEETQ